MINNDLFFAKFLSCKFSGHFFNWLWLGFKSTPQLV